MTLARRAAASVAVFGALSVAAVGTAGQVSATTTPTATQSAAAVQAHKSFLCAKAKKRHVKHVRTGTKLSKTLTNLAAREAKAKAKGHDARAAYLAKIIAHDQTVISHLKKYQNALDSRAAAFVARTCRS
jgi:hypothetical protein